MHLKNFKVREHTPGRMPHEILVLIEAVFKLRTDCVCTTCNTCHRQHRGTGGGGGGTEAPKQKFGDLSLPPPPPPHVLVPKISVTQRKIGKIFWLVIFSQIISQCLRLAKYYFLGLPMSRTQSTAAFFPFNFEQPVSH